ncbi:oxidoreductase FixC [Salmonella enterica subsp. enterica]|uniref:Protein FixC n=1 Tax=Salmonella enterica I TaxID=59201 RepID=A0A447MTI4_SALET|nr:oxidoreductase FixC [Salmonella enterica subsp. enterica]
MSDDKFDAIVVGAGVAGTVAAYVMAKAGLDVLVIERGNSAGSKNMTGGPALRSQYRKYYAGIRNVRPHRTRRYP